MSISFYKHYCVEITPLPKDFFLRSFVKRNDHILITFYPVYQTALIPPLFTRLVIGRIYRFWIGAILFAAEERQKI